MGQNSFLVRIPREPGPATTLAIEITGMERDKPEKTGFVKERWLPTVNSIAARRVDPPGLPIVFQPAQPLLEPPHPAGPQAHAAIRPHYEATEIDPVRRAVQMVFVRMDFEAHSAQVFPAGLAPAAHGQAVRPE